MKSKYHEAVDAIHSAIRPWLTERGFRVRSRAFNRVTEDGLTHVISIQMGRFDPPVTIPIPGFRESLHGQFTVNLGVYVPEVALLHGAGPAKSWIKEYECSIRARLGEVCSEGEDLWWPAEASEDVIEAIREHLLVGGLPWLSRFADRDQILRRLVDPSNERWGGPPRIVMAIIRAVRGETDTARSLLAAQATDATTRDRNLRHADYVRQLAMKLGLGRLDG